MRGCLLALVLLGGIAAAPVRSGPPQGGPAAKQPDPDRIRGLKAAVADIEAGKLALKSGPLPTPAWHEEFVNRLKKEYGVDWVTVPEFSGKPGTEMRGYNDVMTVEIEHRFGKGIIEKLQKQVVDAWEKKK